jgi:DNA repair protein RecN (Recombination protein N)
VLDELIVENLGIIERAHLRPGSGLVVVTGETGAGKTLLLGALRLLFGGPARSNLVGPYGAEARVEGRFLGADKKEFVIARTVASGRSRAYLNGRLATAGALEELGTGLIELVAQHEKHGLSRPAEVKALIDRALPPAGRELLGAYRLAWNALIVLQADLDRLGGDRRALEREHDLVGYQADEISAAGFSTGDDETLVAAATRARHAEELGTRLGEARSALEEAADRTGLATSQLAKTADLDATLRDLAEQAATAAVVLGELSSDVREAFEAVTTDPQAAQVTEQRLAQLGDLRRKYGDTLSEVLEFGEGANRRRAELAGLLEGAERLEADLAVAEQAVAEAGLRLQAARLETAERIGATATAHLQDLGLADPTVNLVVEAAEPGATGADRVGLLFASDDRLEPGPVGRVASGGELSRLVLSLRLAGGSGLTPVLAFDEIDAGVGGKTALALGRKLASLAKNRQVFCVTHLPQVAAFADHHFVVARIGTTVAVASVEGESRLEELSRMLAGLPDSEPGRNHAEELIAMAVREQA